MRRPLLVLVHGILTGQTHPGWVDRFEEWLWKQGAGFEVLKRKYAAGPWPLWNVFVKNAWLARGLANELRPFLQDGAGLNFVTHSNGADIVRQTMARLAREGFRTRSVVHVAGAIRADVRANGVLPLLESGLLERAFAYCSREDFVLRLRATWPSGHLGRVGFRLDDQAFDGKDLARFKARDTENAAYFRKFNKVYATDFFPSVAPEAVVGTRWFRGGHSAYFAPQNEESTFGLLRRDLD